MSRVVNTDLASDLRGADIPAPLGVTVEEAEAILWHYGSESRDTTQTDALLHSNLAADRNDYNLIRHGAPFGARNIWSQRIKQNIFCGTDQFTLAVY